MDKGIIITFLLLFTILIVIISIFLGFTIANHKKEKRLRQIVNDLLNYNINQKVDKISVIGDFAPAYEDIINFAIRFKESLYDNLIQYKKEVIDIAILNQNFNIIKSYRKSSEIKKELLNIYKVIENFDSMVNSILKNDNLCSEIFIKIANFYNELVYFYEKQILKKDYDSPKIDHLVENVKLILTKLNQKSDDKNDSFEMQDYIYYVRRAQENLHEISSTLKRIYIDKQVSLYFESNINEINNNLFSGEFNFTNLDRKLIEKNLMSLKQKYSDFKENILNNVQSTDIIRECNHHISDIKEKMDYSLKSEDFLLKKLTPIFKNIKDRESSLISYINDIKSNFNDEETIQRILVKITKSLSNTMQNCKKVFSKEMNTLSGKEKIDFIYKCKSEMEIFSESVESLNDLLINYCEKFGKIILEILTYKKTIAQMWKKISTCTSNDLNLDIFKEKINQLDNMEKALSKNVKLINNDNFIDELIAIKSWIINIHFSFVKDINLKEIAEDLLVYSYRFLGTKPELDEIIFKCEELYDKKEYQKIIDTLSSKLKKAKNKSYKIGNEKEKICQENI